jgi:hypothetical protein
MSETIARRTALSVDFASWCSPRVTVFDGALWCSRGARQRSVPARRLSPKSRHLNRDEALEVLGQLVDALRAVRDLQRRVG